MLSGVGDILFSGAKDMAGQAGKPRATQGTCTDGCSNSNKIGGRPSIALEYYAVQTQTTFNSDDARYLHLQIQMAFNLLELVMFSGTRARRELEEDSGVFCLNEEHSWITIKSFVVRTHDGFTRTKEET
jgi:hypothetical protein